MSSFDRRAVLMMPLALAACGFEPVYGTGGKASALRGKVRVDAPAGVNTYLLVRRLEEQLGRSGDPTYRLSMTLNTAIQGQAITAEGSITFFSFIGSVSYQLRDIASGAVVTSGTVDNFVGYSATGDTVESLAAQRDARQRLMIILADQVARALYVDPAIPA